MSDKVRCSECGRLVSVKANGALRRHVSDSRDYPGSPWRRVCDASGRLLPPSPGKEGK